MTSALGSKSNDSLLSVGLRCGDVYLRRGVVSMPVRGQGNFEERCGIEESEIRLGVGPWVRSQSEFIA